MIYNSTAQPQSLEHAIAAKVYCTQACLEVTDTALQLFGGLGLTRDCPMEKLYWDARASLIEDGANDVLSLVEARRLLSRFDGN